jgi:hypothetical protein
MNSSFWLSLASPNVLPNITRASRGFVSLNPIPVSIRFLMLSVLNKALKVKPAPGV